MYYSNISTYSQLLLIRKCKKYDIPILQFDHQKDQLQKIEIQCLHQLSQLGINLDIITNVTIQFQMISTTLFKNDLFNQNQRRCPLNQLNGSIELLSRPMPKETLSFFRNLKLNRIIVPSDTPLEETLRIYFKEYRQLYEENKKLNRQFIEVVEEKNQLAEIFLAKMKLKKALGGKIKRKRRFASQIKREFFCPMGQCERRYGSEGSLTQHVKIKHLEFYKSGRYDEYISEIMNQKLNLYTNSQ